MEEWIVTRRMRNWLLALGIPVALIVVLVAVWRWDWFIPLVEARASAAIGRTVKIGHLSVGLGRVTEASISDVTVENPPGWEGKPLAHIERIDMAVDFWSYIRHGDLIIPSIVVIRPDVSTAQTKDGKSNYDLAPAPPSGKGGALKIGDLRVEDGTVHAVSARLAADFNVSINTRQQGQDGRIVADVNGTYNAAPINGQMVGGALLSLRDTSKPWPIDLRLQNGETRVRLNGTVQDPVHFAGADLRLDLSGPDMAQLDALTGVPVPHSPPFGLTARVGYADRRVLLRDLQGRFGRSDIAGSAEVEPFAQRPVVKADLTSQRIDLTDITGFIGGNPGGSAAPKQQAKGKPGLLPDKPISLPQLQWADVHLRYRARQIINRGVPFDNVELALDLEDGRINVHPLSASVGQGQVKVNASVVPESQVLHAQADIDIQRIDVTRLMQSTGVAQGAGVINGTGSIDARGRSLASMGATANGNIRFGMSGGNLSALLVNLSGLQFGNALLSALGVPTRTQIECMVGVIDIRNGVAALKPLVVDTSEGVINGMGTVNLGTEAIDLTLKTEAKHFKIGSLPTPIQIGGTFSSPAILPGAEAAARGGAAVGLGVLFLPLAVLPTIQFGTADDKKCERILASARRQPGGERLPGGSADRR
jgi:AsmA family protein